MNKEYQGLVFDPRTLRLIVGIVAFLLPIITPLRSSTAITSISGSYYTESRDIFVGSLSIIAALLLAYKGRPHPLTEQVDSKARKFVRKILSVKDVSQEERTVSLLGGLSAIGAALYPTSCEGCQTNLNSTIHYICAVILFLTIAYFCLYVFRDSANMKVKSKSKSKNGENLPAELVKQKTIKQRRRMAWYFGCGVGILVCIVAAGVAQLTMSTTMRSALRVTFVLEWASLWLFSFSWAIASHIFSYFSDADEQLNLWESAPMDQAPGT